MPGTLHFKTKAGYDRWEAYGHMHHVFKDKDKPKIVIAGKPHAVMHSKTRR